MPPLSYSGYRFRRDIIQRAVLMYLRFTLSFRDVEELLAERGITVSHESIRRWVLTFGPLIARKLRARRPRVRTHKAGVIRRGVIQGCSRRSLWIVSG
jgi:putative transposase